MKMPKQLMMIGAVSFAVLLAFPTVSEARGGRGDGGGFSRSGVARSGSFTTREPGARQPRDARSSNGARQPRDARSSIGADQLSGASSSIGAGNEQAWSNGRVARAPAVAPGRDAAVRDASVRDTQAEDMAQYRAQFARDNNGVLSNQNADERWDRPAVVDPGYNVPVNGVIIDPARDKTVVIDRAVAAVAAGTAIARNNNYGYVAGGTDMFYSELPCSLQGNMEVSGSMYYMCSSAWYKRVYRGDDIVYVQVPAPRAP